MSHLWTKTNKKLPEEGAEVIAVVRHHPRDRSKKIGYTYHLAIFAGDAFTRAGKALRPVCKWMLSSENQENREERQSTREVKFTL